MRYIKTLTKTKYGSIYKRPDSQFWQIYTNFNGKPSRQTTPILIAKDPLGIMATELLAKCQTHKDNVLHNQRQAIKFCKKFNKKVMEMIGQTYSVMTLHEVIEKYIRSFKKADSTSTIYQTTLNRFKKYLKTDVELDVITPDDIEGFRDSLIEKNLNPSTINQRINHLNIFFNYSIKRGYMNDNPCKSLESLKTKGEKNEARPFTKNELKILLNHVKGTYFETAVLLGLYTGARRNTVFNMKWDDVNFEKESISFYEKKNEKLIIQKLHPQLKAHLLKIHAQKGKEAGIFTKSEKLYISDRFTEILLKTKILHSENKIKAEGDRKNRYPLCFHSLRHNFVSWIAEDKNVSEETRKAAAGHTSLEVNRIYTQISDNEKEKVINALPRIDY